jgi:hypothetical protein
LIQGDMSPLDYPGFVVERERQIFSRTHFFVVRCGAADHEFSFTDGQLEAAIHAPQRVVGQALIDAAERIWSRWMAL